MADQFGRVVQLQVGTVRVDGLRVAFDVSRGLRAEPGRATIRVWNLSEDSRAAILESRRDSGIFVSLSAGYRSGVVGQIFQGDVKRVRSEFDGRDIVTTLEAGDGLNALSGRIKARAFGRGVKLVDILKRVVSDVAVGDGNALSQTITGVLSGRTVGGAGLVIEGSPSNALSSILKSVGLTWSVQDNQILVLGPNDARQDLAVEVSVATGLIGSPSEDGVGEASFDVQLNPDLVPGRLADLRSRLLSGVYRVDSSQFVGDRDSGDFKVSCKSRLLG